MKKIKILSFVILFMSSLTGCATAEETTEEINLTIFLLNTEFFFDHEAPHGRVVGKKIPIPTKRQYFAKAKAIAKLIDRNGANVVGLVEVENLATVEKVRSYLRNPEQWQIAFDEGRDFVTGQDVALLTKFPIVEGSITNFPNEHEFFFVGDREQSVRPSKILGVELKISNERNPIEPSEMTPNLNNYGRVYGADPPAEAIYVLLAHLISKRNENDRKRLAQATVLRRQAVKALMKNRHVIVMGDMNDDSDSAVLKRLRGLDDIWSDLIQTSNEVQKSDRYTYIFNGWKSQIDHVLLSTSLRRAFMNVSPSDRCEIFDPGKLSDHRGLIVRLKFR